jgi:hypothetical protein
LAVVWSLNNPAGRLIKRKLETRCEAEKMAKGKNVKKNTKEQRTMRAYRIVFVVISVIVLLTMIMSLTLK